MRLWSLHPRYLDTEGLVTLWREALLAKAALRGESDEYKDHPQLARFQAHPSPRSTINAYLHAIHAEAKHRGQDFDRSKIGPVRRVQPIPVTGGQLAHEWQQLMKTLASRDPDLHRRWLATRRADCHPLFRRVHGAIEIWERP